jgi:hypothetical protein
LQGASSSRLRWPPDRHVIKFGLAGLTPDQVRVRSIEKSAGNRLIDTGTNPMEPSLLRSAVRNGLFPVIYITREKVSGGRIGSGQERR